MEKIKISKLANQVRGVSYAPDNLHDTLNDNSVILLRANNIDDGKINFDGVVYVDKSKVSKDQYLKKGDILICASSGSKQLVGKAASVDFDSECTFGAFCKVVRPVPEIADYLGVFFQSDIYRNKISEVAIGANINNIRNEHIDSLDVPVGTPSEIADVVRKVHTIQNIINRRKMELQQLDNLVKARFVEMFGDHHTNSKGFELHKGNELFKFSSGKFLPEEKRFSKGVPVYGGNGVAWYTSAPLIDYPTIIIGRVGALCGNIHTVTEPAWITDNAIYIKEQKTDKFTLEFLSQLMKIMDFYQYADFSGQPKITQKPLETIEYITPPIEMQDQFTAFCKQIDKSKVAVQKALDKLQILFDKLMQEYFG